MNGNSTTIYHKPTYTGVYLNWTSLTARKYKISLIYCLCHRIWKISQDPDDRDLELRKLKATLEKNEYPDVVIDKEIEKFVKNRTAPNQTDSEEIPTEKTIEKETRQQIENETR